VPHRKDGWDKAGVVAQFLSGTVIALLGFVISITVDRAQHAASERQQFTEYLKAIGGASEAAARATLIGNLDLAIPKEAVRVATQYASDDPSVTVRDQAMQVLTRFPTEGRPVLERIAQSSDAIDAESAQFYLGQQVKSLFVRLSDIDDDGHLKVNGKEILMVGLSPNIGNDTGWRNIASSLKPGTNILEFLLHNGQYGGWSGRLRISAGPNHRYDSGKLASLYCPCNANAFLLTVNVEMGPDGTLTGINPEPVFYYPPNN